MDNRTIIFPSQKKPHSQKTKEWRMQNVKSAEEYISRRHLGFRQTLHNKIINYNLYSDILDQSDIEQISNPFKLTGNFSLPAKMQNYPIINPKIDLLVGEASKRSFDYRVRVINEDAISDKEDTLKKEFTSLILKSIYENEDDEEILMEKLKRFQRYKNYEFQDVREKAGTQILKHLTYKLRLKKKFVDGFKDALLVAEEIYLVDAINQEIIFERLNPKNVYCVRSGESNFIEDSDIIVVENWYSPGKIIDEYYDDLTPQEIDSLESGSFGVSSSKGIDIGTKRPILSEFTDSINLAMLENDITFRDTFDSEGNIRVVKVFWKSRRKMLKVTKLNEEGEEEVTLEDEKYPIDKTLGEKAEVLWVNEWWEGHKIGGSALDENDSAIYVRMRPKPFQLRDMDNPSRCYPGIVGTIYNTNDNTAVSLMDKMKPYQYMYNILMYNTELLISKNIGKIMSLDLARIPENWKVEEWLSFARTMNIALEDSFKEGKKGKATGKLAGETISRTPVIDMEMGNSIQMYISLMERIKEEVGEISGISRSRQGQMYSRQAVGNTQTEISQSNHITEYWFLQHEETQLRVLKTLLEVAKYAWIDLKSKKIQHVLDDGTSEIFNLDVERFCEADYDLSIINGFNDNMLETVKQMAHAALQNQMIKFSDLIDILTTDSISSVKRKLQNKEEEIQERAEKQSQADREAKIQEANIYKEVEEKKMQNEMEIEMLKIEGKLAEKEMELNNSADGESGIKLQLEIEKIKTALSIAKEKLEEDKRKNREKEKIEREKMSISRSSKNNN
jgi:hypothetical protein